MIYVFLAEGFEEVEALTPVDILRRAGFSLQTVSVSDERTVVGSHGIPVVADTIFSAIDRFSDAELLLLPGGMPGTKHLAACEPLQKLLLDHAAKGKPLAAICAAPSVLGELGILQGKEAICYPGFEAKLTGARISDKCVVRDGNILTAAGAGVAMDFALAAVAMLASLEKADEIRRSVIATR